MSMGGEVKQNSKQTKKGLERVRGEEGRKGEGEGERERAGWWVGETLPAWY